MPVAGTLSNFYVRINEGPDNGGGANGDAYTFTVRKNGADETSLECTITEAAVDCSDNTGSVSFAAGDRIAIKSQAANAPAPRFMHWTAKYTTP